MKRFMGCLLVGFILVGSITPVWAAGSEWEQLNAEVLKLYRQGNLKKAAKVANQALELAKTKGLEHPTVALSLHNLGLILQESGEITRGEYGLSVCSRYRPASTRSLSSICGQNHE